MTKAATKSTSAGAGEPTKTKVVRALFLRDVAKCPVCAGPLFPTRPGPPSPKSDVKQTEKPSGFWVCPAQPAHVGLIESQVLGKKLRPMIVIRVADTASPTPEMIDGYVKKLMNRFHFQCQKWTLAKREELIKKGFAAPRQPKPKEDRPKRRRAKKPSKP